MVGASTSLGSNKEFSMSKVTAIICAALISALASSQAFAAGNGNGNGNIGSGNGNANWGTPTAT